MMLQDAGQLRSAGGTAAPYLLFNLLRVAVLDATVWDACIARRAVDQVALSKSGSGPCAQCRLPCQCRWETSLVWCIGVRSCTNLLRPPPNINDLDAVLHTVLIRPVFHSVYTILKCILAAPLVTVWCADGEFNLLCRRLIVFTCIGAHVVLAGRWGAGELML
jgi:hypothetical protein